VKCCEQSKESDPNKLGSKFQINNKRGFHQQTWGCTNEWDRMACSGTTNQAKWQIEPTIQGEKKDSSSAA
jgi:hypothetical protein